MVVTLAGGPFSCGLWKSSQDPLTVTAHYFCPKSSTGYLEKDGQPTGRVGSWEAFGKAFKYSMGATAFGSFLIGLIHLIHDIVSSLISSAGEWAVCLCYLCNMFVSSPGLIFSKDRSTDVDRWAPLTSLHRSSTNVSVQKQNRRLIVVDV